jgi:hypothetical protein
MKKIFITLGIVTASGMAFYLYQSKEGPFPKKIDSVAPYVLLPSQKEFTTKRLPSSKIKDRSQNKNPLDDFPREDIELFKGRYALVDGAFAMIAQMEGKRAIHSFGGFTIYEQREENANQVVFDKENKQYGVFTGEVKIYGNYMKLLPLIERSGLEIMYKNIISGEIIIKIETLDNKKILDQVLAEPNTRIVPDIKYSRLRGM